VKHHSADPAPQGVIARKTGKQTRPHPSLCEKRGMAQKSAHEGHFGSLIKLIGDLCSPSLYKIRTQPHPLLQTASGKPSVSQLSLSTRGSWGLPGAHSTLGGRKAHALPGRRHACIHALKCSWSCVHNPGRSPPHGCTYTRLVVVILSY